MTHVIFGCAKAVLISSKYFERALEDGLHRYTAQPDLQAALEQRCKKVRKLRSTVLFRRGERAFGMFLIFSGTASLDFGVDSSAGLANTYAPGALVGLPATLTGSDYNDRRC